MSKYYNKYLSLLFVFYLTAHGGILLLPSAIYWDDWNIYQQKPEPVIELFTEQAGTLFYLEGYMHVAMLKVGPWSYKLFTFVLMFATGLILNGILKRHLNISPEIRFFIVLLFLVLPFNLSRVALITFRYTLCYFMFFLGWLLIDRHRIWALFLFFMSFNTNSTLVFYAVPIFDSLYRSGTLSSWRSMLRFSVRHVDFLLLPFIYFYIKLYYFPPTGSMKGYNEEYAIRNLFYAPIPQLIEVFGLKTSIGFAGLLSVIVFYTLQGKVRVLQGKELFTTTLFSVGAIAFILACFPYWILGKVPSFAEWTSRHQLLLPLGVSLITVAAWSYLNGSLGVISIVVGLSLAVNISAYKDFFIDWQKQQQLIYLFSENSKIFNGRLIIIDDRTESMNAISRVFRFYEWNGLLEAAFGDEKRFGINRAEIPIYLAGKYDRFFTALYNAESFKRDFQVSPINVEINRLKSEKIIDKFKRVLFPQFSLTVTKANLNAN